MRSRLFRVPALAVGPPGVQQSTKGLSCKLQTDGARFGRQSHIVSQVWDMVGDVATDLYDIQCLVCCLSQLCDYPFPNAIPPYPFISDFPHKTSVHFWGFSMSMFHHRE